MSLSAPLPLRQTTVWGAFGDARVIPHRYGETAGKLLQYDAAGRVWCWADHACVSVDKVTVNGAPAGAWQWRNGIDSTGHAVTLVEFGQPQDTGADILATGKGKAHPRAGDLMTSPAAVVWDVLANVAGGDASEGELTAFHADCYRRGLVVAGSITDADSAQTVVRAICASVGAIFCANGRGLCLVWPGADDDVARATVDHRHKLSAQAAVGDICNDLTMEFDVVDGTARQSLHMDAPDSVARFGRRRETLAASWISLPRVAYDVAARVLAQRARPQWVVDAIGLRDAVKVLDDVVLDHPVLPVGGQHSVLSCARDFESGETTVQFRVPMGDPPAVRLIGQSSAFAPVVPAITSTTVGSERILTLRRAEDNTAIAGASVTVDNRLTRTSDSAGRVSFPAAMLTPGAHRLDIVTLDGRTLIMLVTVDAAGNFSSTVLMPPLPPPPPPPPPEGGAE